MTGFLGSHVAKLLVDRCMHKFKLRFAVRSLEKLEPFKETFGLENFNACEVVEGFDLLSEEKIREGVRDCTYVIHVASPLPGKVAFKKGAMENTAQTGMSLMIQACEEFKVKKLIVTSSIATINGTCWKPSGSVYNESDFCYDKPNQRLDGYMASKCLQEREIISYLEGKKKAETGEFAEGTVEICTLHPSFIVGPPLNKATCQSSVEGFQKMVSG
mmetsp:Transcript_1561/g.2755  ORF Transcript_1561/g.2755 Transcript_1561/m.2755 type:complete len:216 (-) Transcript_1561:475-1122(-)